MLKRKMRNKIFIPLLLVVMAIGAIIAGVSFTNNSIDEQLPSKAFPEIGAPTTEINITLGAGMALPVIPDKIMVYKVKKPEVTAEKVTALAETLGLIGDVSEDANRCIVKHDSLELEVLKASGRLFYRDSSKIYGDINNPPNLPLKETAIKSAKKFLSDNGLMPADAEFSKVVTDTAEIARKDPATGDVSTEKIDLVMQVIFDRKINGFPVVGAGSKLKVYIGNNGDVVGVYKCWREYEPYKQFTILTPSQALERLREKGIHRVITGEEVKVKEVYLAYYAEPSPEDQEYFQPVYVFEVDIGRGEIVEEYIPAIPEIEPKISEKPQPQLPERTKPAPDELEDDE